MEIDDHHQENQNTSTTKVKQEETKPIVVLLVGPPGSGKSTFCDEVMKISTRSWARICQDVINNGKAGNKNKCLSAASAALKEGKNVFIDRCNMTREQRDAFLNLGTGQQTEKHAVVLDLPAKVCISRSVKRAGHEGNLQGGRAAAVVNQMLSKKELPKLAEGFYRITFCQDEKDVKEAINLYGSFDSPLPCGYFGQKKISDTMTQQGIMRFLKKVDPSGDSGSGRTDDEKPTPNEISVERVEEVCKMETASSSGDVDWGDVHTLAFPSISTADFEFDREKASEIIIEQVEEFIRRNEKLKFRLILVDLSPTSRMLSLVKSKAVKRNIGGDKFFTFDGDITQLRSQKGLHCSVIANTTNWRLKPGGGGINAAIFKAAGPELDMATKERAESLSPGKALVVPLPSTSPLCIKEGVTHVIHVLGPNMNPKRPDCLKGDYVKGSKILREAYSSLFEGFLSIVQSQRVVSELNIGKSSNDDMKSKREAAEAAVYESEKNKRYKGSEGTSKAWGSWAQALHNVAMEPDKHKNVVLEVFDDVIVMNDAYPKAKHHLLVIARDDGLDSIADVRKEHISLLKRMHDVGLKWAEKFINENGSLLFRLGYHSAPSMRQLHLHVISQDFDSSHFRNKKHWNSFNTPFFLDSVDVMKELEEDQENVTLQNDSKYLDMELRCHRCKSAHPNIPRLKSHISSCQSPFPATLLENGRLISSTNICN